MGRGRRGKGGRGSGNSYAKPDRFTRQAKAEGYLARSVYKLAEMNKRHRILKQGDRVVDLGCSPGSWLVWAREQVGRNGSVVGVDIDEPGPVSVPVIVRDIFEVSAAELREAVGGQVQVVLSDMAPRTTGNVFGDHVRQLELAHRALDIAEELLVPGGHFVVKIFDGEDAPPFVTRARGLFDKVKRQRPEAVRKESREFFLVGLGFRGRSPEEQ
jgi:23S rRNA (uridine2552-2'-O)-methyltransferase